jgi:hypothetical protein
MHEICDKIQDLDEIAEEYFNWAYDSDSDTSSDELYEKLRDGYIRLAKLLIKHGCVDDFGERDDLGPSIEFLEEAIEERKMWVCRRGLVLLLEGLDTAPTAYPPLLDNSLASTHKCNTKSTWCCCGMAKLRTSRVVQVPTTEQSTASSSGTREVRSRLNPLDRVVANTDLTKHIIAFI